MCPPVAGAVLDQPLGEAVDVAFLAIKGAQQSTTAELPFTRPARWKLVTAALEK
jgi:hypothetical protein